MFAVPTMAADDVQIPFEQLEMGKPIIISDTVDFNGETLISELEITQVPCSLRAPGYIQTEVKGLMKRNDANYAYFRTMILYSKEQGRIIDAWEPPNRPADGYLSRGAKGSFELGDCLLDKSSMQSSPSVVVQTLKFYEYGRPGTVVTTITVDNGGMDTHRRENW